MITVKKISDEKDLASAHQIRKTVFVEEQHCPEELEWEYDEESVHFLGCFNNLPCAAARWRQTTNGYKLERFAVLKEFRKKGVASILLLSVLEDLPERSRRIYLHSQLDAIPFYLKFGFLPEGELFEEAGIVHQLLVYSGSPGK